MFTKETKRLVTKKHNHNELLITTTFQQIDTYNTNDEMNSKDKDIDEVILKSEPKKRENKWMDWTHFEGLEVFNIFYSLQVYF